MYYHGRRHLYYRLPYIGFTRLCTERIRTGNYAQKQEKKEEIVLLSDALHTTTKKEVNRSVQE